MQLPFLKNHKKEQVERKYLFAIEISPSVVKGAVWTVVNDKTQVVAVGHPVNWDDKTAESLIAAIDESISDAANHLDPSGKLSPDQAILGLSATWVQEEKIVNNKLVLLKEMAQKLELKLVGFVVTPEAVVKYLHYSENVPPTAILLGFWPHHLELTLVKLGKIQGIQLVNRSHNVSDDVVEGLSRFANVDMLPSRMLMYDSGMDLEEVKQQLLAYPWQAPQKKLPFLHFPKIEALPGDYTVRAIALAGGTEVARAIGLMSEEPAAPISNEVPVANTSPVTNSHPMPNIPVGASLEELGFVSEGEIVPMHQNDRPETELTAEPSPMYRPMPKKARPAELRLPTITLPHFGHTKFVIAAALLLLVVCGLGFGYWYLPHATVDIYLTPKVLSQNFVLTADTKASSVDATKPSIPAQLQAVTVSGDKSGAATGSKLIGDKAKGQVTILNSTDSSRSLAAGTVLTSPSGLKFVLDEAITVASGSGSVFNPQPGKATANVTASVIGTDSNLSGGTEFRVGSFAATQIAARNDQAISGGSSQQVKAVSKDDINALRTGLVADLKAKAKDQLMAQVGEDKTIISESITTETLSEEFNHKEGDAADNVTLTLKVKAQGVLINKTDLAEIVQERLRPSIPEGFEPTSDLSQNFAVKKADKDIVTFDVQVSVNLLPKLDINQVATDIAGKLPTKVHDYLVSLPSVSQVDIAINPPLPGSLNTMPHVSKNISISVKTASE